jgi:hypothetical protein
MPTRKWKVTHEDGRQTVVCAPDEALARRQANHAETSRVVIATKRGLPPGPPPSMAVSAECLEKAD